MKNLLNLRWLHGSPNQTGETLTRENRLGIVTCLNPMRTLLITLLLLTLGTGQMWGWSQIYLVGDPCVNNSNHWTDQNYAMPETSNNSGERYIFIYMEKDWYFKFRVNNKPVGNDSPGVSFTSYNSGARMYKWDEGDPSAAKYSGLNTGIVRICTKQESNASGVGNTDEKPWVWLLRPNIMIRHNWGGSSWSDQQMTDNQDGTYTYDGNWGGNYTYVGVTDMEYNENGSNCYKKFQNIATVYGNPSNGNACVFEYDATNYASIGGSTANTGTLTIRAYCTIAYNGNDNSSGSVPSSQTSQRAGIEMTLQGNTNSLTKNGYTLTGWNTEADGSGIHYDLSASFTPNEVNTTLYTEWTATITLNSNGGISNGSATTLYKSSNELTITTAPTRTGYYVTGYYAEEGCTTKVAETDGTLVAGVTGFTDADGKWIATEDKTLYAKWDNHYSVTLDDDDASIHGTTSTTATYGEAMPAITVPSKTGYIFDGYYTNTSDENTKYYNANGTSAKNWNLTANTTLHAKWRGISYQVAFDANEGIGTIDNQGLTYGAAATALTSNTTQITRTGYYFLGWNTNADGSGTAFYNGKSVQNLTSVNNGIVTLYAQWAKTHTLYFLNMGVDSWNNVSGNQASTVRYAYAFISYDGHEMYPLGTYSANSSQGTRMTASASITLPNVGTSPTTWCWSIDGVPEGATIIFSDNTDNHKTGNLSGWTSSKPYYCNGNGTWYALDGDNSISQVTNMSVHIGEGDFGSWKYVGIDKHGDGGEDQYAIIWLNKNQTYQFKFSNWYQGGESGSDYGYSIINGDKTKADYGGEPRTLSGTNNVNVNTTTHASGEYKFVLTGWDGDKPKTRVYVPRGVNLTSTSPTQAPAGKSVTVSLQADAWTNLSSGTDMDNPTYTFQFSTDNSNWTDIAVVSPESNKMQATTDYTFTARSGYFRVKLVNDNGLASYSGSTAFTVYTTKSFYVYNPWNNSTDKWQYLELYTWKENGDAEDVPHNGALGECYIPCNAVKGTHGTGCLHGNDIEAMGDNWFKITIDERADYFLLAGNRESDDYAGHKTGDLAVVNYIQDAKYMLTDDGGATLREYQAKGASDFRLKYTDGSGNELYSDIYNTTLDEATVTASLWMNAHATSPTLVIQQGSGNNTWSDAVTYSGTGFTDLLPTGKTGHGYVFQMDLNLSSPAVSNVTEYTGPFYVRTDGLEGGWNAYKNNPKNTMHHSTGSLSGTPAYNYYLCKWINEAGTNVKFTVANDYNKELVASLVGDVNSTDPLYNRQTVPTPTNVRFSWNSQTNTLARAYLSGATAASERFLVLVEQGTVGKIYNESGTDLTSAAGGQVSGLNEHELLFADNGNWVYQLDMKANPGAQAKVTAKYNGEEPEFIPTTTLISGKGDSNYKYRITYDFKTNILTNAWVADGSEINTEINLNTNVMIIRDGQDPAVQIEFAGSGNVIHAQKLLGVMQFDYNNMVGKMNSWNSTAYQNCMYYISFPYDVNVSDIFGIGEMGVDWKLQYYDGAERASKGFFRGDGTTTFWKDMPADGVMKAYVGYSLLLNRIKFNDSSSDIWENKRAGSSVYLYFPSAIAYTDSIIKSGTKTIHVPAHECTIDRTFGSNLNHKFTDSHWNMLGLPIFQNQTGMETEKFVITRDDKTTPFEANSGYFYEWSAASNSFAVRSTTDYTFNAMHAYMVQFTGDIEFTGSSIHKQASIVSRRAEKNTKNYMMELELLRENTHVSRTYVELREEACDTFALNEDMYMMYTSMPADIYTYAGSYDVAANVLTLETTTVPVGVTVRTAGKYTFSMPSHFDGTVKLIDTYAQTRTNLGIEDYTVDLEEGTFNSRFLLELNIHQAPTAIDGVSDGTLKDGKAHKFLQNGVMYILQNGMMYDAQGKRVK